MHRTPSKSFVMTRNAKKQEEARAKDEVKAESIEGAKMGIEGKSVTSKARSARRSTSSSAEARKKKLELEAAEAKARIQMELIDKKLEADLAELEEEEKYSSIEGPRSEVSNKCRKEVEQWLDKSQLEETERQVTRSNVEMEKLCTQQSAGLPHMDPTTLPFVAPPPQLAQPAAGTDGTVEMLASALKDLAAASSANMNGPNSRMLSRLCTPKDLPTFSGDPMDWLHFKKAYVESTQVCHFSERENLWRLRNCLHGLAKEAVSALLISATSPDIIISTLELQFGNPDIIISRILRDINKLHPMSQEYHKDIIPFSIKVRNYVAAVTSIGNSEYLQGINIASAVLCKLPTVLISKWADYSYNLVDTSSKPKLVLLSEFLTEEANKISKTAVNLGHLLTVSSKVRTSENYHSRQTVLVQNERSNYKENSDPKCGFCRQATHALTDCRTFKKSLRKNRWFYVKRRGLCFKCLTSRHLNDTCPAPACDIDNCGGSHHRLLHYTVNNQSAKVSSEKDSECVETVANINVNSYRKVLLKTVSVTLHGPNKTETCTALLDDASTVTIINSELASRVGLTGRRQTMRVGGAWTNSELVCETTLMDIKLSNKNGTSFIISARSVNNLNLPVQSARNIDFSTYDLSEEVKSDICDGLIKKPELLIGQDNYHLLEPLEIIKGSSVQPYLTRTLLGWCIHGCIKTPPHKVDKHTIMCVCEHSVSTDKVDNEQSLREIHEDVQKYFAIESMGVTSKPRENSEDVRALEHLQKTSRLIDGRWYVGLPWKDPNCSLCPSYLNALNRLKGVERKMGANENYANRFKQRINHLFENDYASEVTNPAESNKIWYLPYFGVDNPNKQKLRLVFDAAAKSNGLCLNDYLLKGPDLLMSLLGIMLRFREKKVAVMADIRDMFLRVKIQPEDRDAFRFLWRDSMNDEVRVFTMTSLIFGANCSPFIAQFVKNKNAECYETSMPAAVHAIKNQHYVDDYIDSVEDEATAIKLASQITQIHSQGGFELRNWSSNSESVLNSLPKDSLNPNTISFKTENPYEGERTLGLIWFPSADNLGFNLSLKRIPEAILNAEKKPTKRMMLRVIMSIFDVYGFLSPFTIKARIILQDTWRAKIDWDDELTDTIFIKWKEWLKLLKPVSAIRLPRHYQSCIRVSETERDTPVMRATEIEDAPSANALHTVSESPPTQRQPPPVPYCYTNLEMHMFCDASSQAMNAVAYWRWINNNGDVCVAFIASKCRVASLKVMSIPRKELEAALLAARLANCIKTEHTMKAVRYYFWSDSTTVLHWIRNDARSYKSYVAHRLGEIDELTNSKEWRYVPSALNIADIATRETCDLKVFKNEWLHGPQFLYDQPENWPTETQRPLQSSDVDPEYINIVHVPPLHLPAVPAPERFSSWLRLVRSTCVVLAFIQRCKKLSGEIDAAMLERAEMLLIKYSQRLSFTEDIQDLKHKKYVQKKSKLLTLSPYLDENGVIRVGGRINAASGVPLEVKQPIILDGRCTVAQLIVKHYHVKYAHGNRETVVNEVKQKYWITRLRPTVKYVASRCMFCRIRKAKPEPPRMGDLPGARLAHHQRPFTFTGLDLFGPMDVTVGRRREKRYGVIFTCLTVRAVHIEIVSSLTTDALIMALRRMAARRGWPKHLFSDNGTNLRGADNELKKSIEDLDNDLLKQEALNYGCSWTFIPPLSPHWGGAWERLIRSIKTALKTILKERAPRDEVLSTLMAEVEFMVNNRPLSYVAVEPNSDESLTPNHFLLGSPSSLPVLGAFDDSDMYLRKQWRISQRLADQYWKRWVKEILPDMRPRGKWHSEQRPIQVGDLVLIVDPDSTRNSWPRGRVVRVLPGKDGRVRVVDVKTKSGVSRRSVARVARLPVREECCASTGEGNL